MGKAAIQILAVIFLLAMGIGRSISEASLWLHDAFSRMCRWVGSIRRHAPCWKGPLILPALVFLILFFWTLSLRPAGKFRR